MSLSGQKGNWHVCPFQSLLSISSEERAKRPITGCPQFRWRETWRLLFQFLVSFSHWCVPHHTSFYSSVLSLYVRSPVGVKVQKSPEESRASRKDPEESSPAENCSHLHSHHGVRISLLCRLSEARTQIFACVQLWWVFLQWFVMSYGFSLYYWKGNKDADCTDEPENLFNDYNVGMGLDGWKNTC